MTASELVGRRILVVEDEPLIAVDIIDQLSELGADCIGPALTLKEALSLVESEVFDCAVLDIRVGSDSVFPVARRLAERKIGFVFHTGNCDKSVLKKDWPGCRVIEKPASSASLIASIKGVLVPAKD